MGNKSRALTIAWDYLVMSLGCLIFCFSWEAFMIPNQIASGGLTGVCTIIQYATGFPVSLSYIALNVFLLISGFLILGNGFGIKTIYCIALTTVLFAIMPKFPFLHSIEGQPLYISEKVLLPIMGGLIEAIGISMIFRQGGSTGGTDVIALILGKFWPVSPGKVYICFDVFIIASILILPGKGVQDMVYGYIAMITFSLFLDFILLGSKATVQILIFSSKYKEIADELTSNLRRGVTALEAIGWYTQKPSKVLIIMVRKTQLSLITKAIKSIDPDAFVSVSSASAVYGRGFDEMKTGLERKKKQK